MKNLRIQLLMPFALAAILFTNCKKEENEIPLDESHITYNVRLNQVSNATLSWSSGICVVSEITWDAILEGNTLPTSITHSKVTTIDLFTGMTSPEIILTKITPGKYTNVGIGVELEDNGVDDNIILDGEYTHTDGTKFPIRFLFNSGEVFEASLASYLFAAGTNTTCWLELDPNGWFSVVSRSDMDDATSNLTNGVMIISESANTTVYNQVEEQLVATTNTSGTIVFVKDN